MNSLTNTKTISAGIICKALNSYFAGNCRYKLANAFIFKDDWESDITRNEEKDWELFKIPEEDVAKYEFDGHTSKDVINRQPLILSKYLKRYKPASSQKGIIPPDGK